VHRPSDSLHRRTGPARSRGTKRRKNDPESLVQSLRYFEQNYQVFYYFFDYFF
jgi:hypothetical protein